MLLLLPTGSIASAKSIWESVAGGILAFDNMLGWSAVISRQIWMLVRK